MNKNHKRLLQFFLTVLLLIGISGCQTDTPEPVNQVPNSQMENSPSTSEPSSSSEDPAENTPIDSGSEEKETDPEAITIEWENSAHADTYVVDEAGKNNACAKCHAPIEWSPTLEDLPESCFTCKFELSEPPSVIAESQWQSITCKVCHETDKKGNVAPEFSWLEVAALEEYTPVENVNELCLKCHAPSNLPEHIAIVVGGAHAEFLCTGCHNAHTLTTSCGESACHETLQDPEKIIPGHDEDHINVACEACHDASGLDVGPVEETGIWTTFAPWSVDLEGNTESGLTPFVSHNTVLEASCDRCHFANNPWNLTVDIENQ